MKKEWAEILFFIWNECRHLPAWMDVWECHDEEDKDYFQMLDTMENVQ